MEVVLHYGAILVTAIVAMALGALWYSPAVFGKMWMNLCGFTEKHMEEAKKKGMGKSMVLAFLAQLVMAYVLAHFVQYAGAAGSIVGGLQAGFWIWLGFIATTLLNSVLWEGKPVKLYLLNIAHYLLVLLVSGVILAVWT